MAISGDLMGFFDFLKSLLGGGSTHSSGTYSKSSVPAARSSPRPINNNPKCTEPTCSTPVYKPEHTLCYYHWSANASAEKAHARLMDRSIGHHKQQAYDRLLSFLSSHMGKPLDELDEQGISQALAAGIRMTEEDIKAFLESPTTRGLLGWTPRHDLNGQGHEGNEWAEHNGVKWYRPVNKPGSWLRHG